MSEQTLVSSALRVLQLFEGRFVPEAGGQLDNRDWYDGGARRIIIRGAFEDRPARLSITCDPRPDVNGLFAAQVARCKPTAFRVPVVYAAGTLGTINETEVTYWIEEDLRNVTFLSDDLPQSEWRTFLAILKSVLEVTDPWDPLDRPPTESAVAFHVRRLKAWANMAKTNRPSLLASNPLGALQEEEALGNVTFRWITRQSYQRMGHRHGNVGDRIGMTYGHTVLTPKRVALPSKQDDNQRPHVTGWQHLGWRPHGYAETLPGWGVILMSERGRSRRGTDGGEVLFQDMCAWVEACDDVFLGGEGGNTPDIWFYWIAWLERLLGTAYADIIANVAVPEDKAMGRVTAISHAIELVFEKLESLRE